MGHVWRDEIDRGCSFYKIAHDEIKEESKEAYLLALSLLIESIEEIGFLELKK